MGERFPSLDFAAIADAALRDVERLVPMWLPDGQRRAAEWVCLNPRRNDRRTGSFSVNMNTGCWGDFASGEGGGDLISLYAYLNGVNNGEAGRALVEILRMAVPVAQQGAPVEAKKRRSEWWALPCAPADAPAPPKAHVKRGTPERVWRYAGPGGETLGYVCRFRTSDGGKEILPLVWAGHETKPPEWRFMAFAEPRPLYGLDRLAAWPDAEVVVVEGEKCADAAATVFPPGPCISWPGGGNADGKSDWQPLAGKRVLLWPDADSQREKPKNGEAPDAMPFLPANEQPGQKTMLRIAARLHALGCEVRMVGLPPPGTLPDGWDVADAVAEDWDKARVLAFVDAHAVAYVPAVGDAAETPVSKIAAPPAAPYEGESAGELTLNLDYMTRHWCVIWGTSEVWDALERQRIKERAARQLAGKDLYDAWRDLPAEQRRKIKPSQLSGAATARGGAGGLAEAFERYVLLYGTTDVYDRATRKRFGLDALKASLGKAYTDWIDGDKKQIPVENLVFDPLQRHDPETHINTFDGLPLIPDADIEKCRPIIYLLKHLCRDEGKEAYEWLLKWLAYPLQHVGGKMATAVIMHGDTHGTGKSMFWELVYKRIYGRFAATLGQGQLESNWTEWKQEKLFVLFEEILNRSDKYSHIGEIKHAITGATHQISKKFVSTWEEANHLNMAFLSNEHQPIPVEPADRRFLVIWTREQLAPEWQRRVDEACANGGVEAFYHYLLTLDLGDFTPNTKPPMTKAKARLIDFGLPSWELFYRDWADGVIEYAPFQTCRSEDLYTAYCRYCTRSGERALPQNKVLNLLGTRVPRERKHYQVGAGTRQATLFCIDGPAEGVEAGAFYARAMQAFREKLGKEGGFDD